MTNATARKLDSHNLTDVGPDSDTDGGWVGTAVDMAHARAVERALEREGYEVSVTSDHSGVYVYVGAS